MREDRLFAERMKGALPRCLMRRAAVNGESLKPAR